MTLFVVSGAFLAGLVAAGVPLALHLLNRRPKEEIPFPGLLFLLQSETKARSGGSWRRRLILLCRVLAVAAPVALMALLAVVTAYLVDGSFNPFLYFRF